MSYIVKQKIRGKTYVYEAVGYWDPEKKQARQKRKYLGVWDEKTGEIIPKQAERDVRTTKSFGQVYLLFEVCKGIKLKEKLENALGPDGKDVLALAMSKVLQPEALRNIVHVMGDSCIAEMCSSDASFKSQWLSDFLRRLARNEVGMRRFYSSLVGDDESGLVYDITTLTSHSKSINRLEYGDDYRKLGLPQVNLGLVVSTRSKLPLYSKLFPGCVNDVVTLKNLVADVKDLGIGDCTFILDRGFYSESNVKEMQVQGIDFVMPLPFSTKIGKNSISATNLNIETAGNARRFDSGIYYVVEKDIELGKGKVFAYILFNEKRRGDEITAFYNRLMDIEASLEGKRPFGDAYNHFKRVANDFSNYFEFELQEDIIHLERKPKAISQAVNRMGKTILLSSSKREWGDVLMLYRERDIVEKLYDELKNDLEMLPLRIHKNEALFGLTLIYFVAVIIRSLLVQKARKAKLLEKNSTTDLLLEMQKLRAVHIGNVWKLTEVTKRQRTILEKMGISIPLTPSLVIKNSGV